MRNARCPVILRQGVRSDAYAEIELSVWFLIAAKCSETLTLRCVLLAARGVSQPADRDAYAGWTPIPRR